MYYAGGCYSVFMDGVNACRDHRDAVRKSFDGYFKEEGILDMIMELYNAMEEYNYLTLNNK